MDNINQQIIDLFKIGIPRYKITRILNCQITKVNKIIASQDFSKLREIHLHAKRIQMPEEKSRKILDLHAKGFYAKQIHSRVNLPYNKVLYLLRSKFGNLRKIGGNCYLKIKTAYYPDIQTRYRNGETLRQIAKRYHVTSEGIRCILRKTIKEEYYKLAHPPKVHEIPPPQHLHPEIMNLYRKNLPYYQISKEVQWDKDAIVTWLKNTLGSKFSYGTSPFSRNKEFQERAIQLRLEGLSVLQIAKIFNIAYASTLRFLKKHFGSNWKPISGPGIGGEYIPEAVKLLKSGMSAGEVAKKFNRTYSRIYQIRKQYKIHPISNIRKQLGVVV